MKRLPIRFWLLLLFLAANGCDCLGGDGGGCESSNLTIERTAPPQGAVTGRQQRFAVIVGNAGSESKDTVKAAVRIDGDAWLQCSQGLPSEQNIDGDRLKLGEIYFSCPVTAVTLPPGNHTAEFSADTPGAALPVRAQVGFFHDTIPPAVAANVAAAPGGNAIDWSVDDEGDFDRVGLFVNGVEVTRAYEESGQFLLDESVRGRGARVEVRAYDKAGNDGSQVVELR